jgi:hypothetical protein
MSDDRDVIDIAIPANPSTAQGHLDWVRDLIAHRAPEIDASDIADAFRGDNPGDDDEPDAGAGIWLEVAERVIDAIQALEERLDRLERTINAGDEDDGPDEPRGR